MTMCNDKPTQASNKGSSGGVGWVHVQYEHGNMPKLLHVSCPKCGALAMAEAASLKRVSKYRELPYSHWDVKCFNCVFRTVKTSYEDLPKLFWRAEAAGVEIWAWNREHFAMLRKLLAKESICDDSYSFYATYARKEWLVTRNRGRLLKAVTKVLETP